MSLRTAGLSHCIRPRCRPISNLPYSYNHPPTFTRPSNCTTTDPTSLSRPTTGSWNTGRYSQAARRSIQTQRFQSFAPPSPESLGKARPAKLYSRSLKWGRRLLYTSVVAGTLYLIDSQLYASSITRSLRTFALGIVVATDYKLNFRPKPLFGGDIADLHRRNAEKLFNLLHQNGGLYLKVCHAMRQKSCSN